MSEKGLYRGVYSSLLDDRDFRCLSPEARHVFHAIRLGREAGPGCIFQSDPPVLLALLSGRTGYPLEVVDRALAELATPAGKPWVLREVGSGVVWVRNGLRHDPTTNLSNDRQRAAVLRSLLSLPRSEMVRKFARYYGISKDYGIAYRNGYRIASRIGYGIATPQPSDQKTETETETETEKKEKEGSPPTSPRAAPPTESTPGFSRNQDGTGPPGPPGGSGAEEHRRCPHCRHTWLGGPRCPKEASHAPRPARPVAT